MEILGIGFGELLLIVLIILILFGPKEMVKTGKTLGQWLNQMVRSPTYQVLTKTGEELKNLPRNLMREANLQDLQEDINKIDTTIRGQAKEIGDSLNRSFDENKIFEGTETGNRKKESASPSNAKETSPEHEKPSPFKEA